MTGAGVDDDAAMCAENAARWALWSRLRRWA